MSKLEAPKIRNATNNILVLDDEYSIRWVLEQTLTEAGYTTYLAENVSEARIILQKHHIRLALIDIHLPEIDGISFTREILKKHPSLITIVMTGQSTVYSTVEAMKAGAFDYIAKPFNIEEIEELVEKALRIPIEVRETNNIL